jgi:hypothetical protein
LYVVVYGGAVYRLVPAHPGDADLNGIVDATDLGTLASNWQTTGASWAMGDFNDDGVVDVADLGILATHWQTGDAPGAFSEALGGLGLPVPNAPEPAVGVPMMGLLLLRRFGRRR